ncbi:MFS transporter [Streptomyces daliensis]|uniref:MFS transporter n=1 Tax=Streptomyces daliensis TaxID=299421 RepID=A0A8T4IMJ1_9ACTN|nr:MFS transporter [Streptomyces daliensis]
MFAAWLGYLLDGFDFVLITLVLTEIADEFGLSTVEAASLVSGAFITRWLGGALLGGMGDRYGRKPAMIASILLYSLGTFACGFAWNYHSLFAARLAIGMGMAGEYSASATYVLESWPVRMRNRASGFLISGYAAGTVLAAEVYKWVVPSLGWRWMFWIGVLPIVVALWVRRALPEAGDWQAEVHGTGTRTGTVPGGEAPGAGEPAGPGTFDGQDKLDAPPSPPTAAPAPTAETPAQAQAQAPAQEPAPVPAPAATPGTGESGPATAAVRGGPPRRPNPFRPLFGDPRRAVANSVLAILATVALFLVFTPLAAGLTWPLALVAAGCLIAFAVQLGGRRSWVVYVALMVTVFCAFLYSWPIQSLLPTYLKTELGYGADEVTDVMYYAGFGTMLGCWLAGFVGDWLGTRRAYALTLLASLAFVFPVFAVQNSLVGLGVLLFGLLALSQGISGLLPKYIAGHFPVETRAASLGFVYNVGALGGAVAPVMGAELAEGMTLAQSLAILTFGLTTLVIVLVGLNVPYRLNRYLLRRTGHHDVTEDHLAAVTATQKPRPAD